MLTSLEVCAGAGGQALGLEQAGFHHLACVELDRDCCATLQLNRNWRVEQADLQNFDGASFAGKVDLFAGGLPCPPFSIAGKQLGEKDERNLFPAALRLIEQIKPRAILIENVKGLLGPSFTEYRAWIESSLQKLGYVATWKLLNASDFGVPQLRPRALMVALPDRAFQHFRWPEALPGQPPTVGQTLHDLMASKGWRGAKKWATSAGAIAPTLVGGSKKHGGPDLGPTRAKRAWADLGVDGMGLVDDPPGREFKGMPRLTVRMAARLQGFPDQWIFSGRKTAAYRQVGNAFPPPVAFHVGLAIREALAASDVGRPKVAEVA
jgi:DNA (cytosine-5)-methyltransferase 1